MDGSVMRSGVACCLVVLALGLSPALAGYYATTVETDKAAYEVGEWATVTHTILNPSEEAVYIYWSWVPGYEMFVYDSPGDLTSWELYLDREPVSNIVRGHYNMYWDTTLLPGETIESERPWDLTDYDEQLLPPGEYAIVETFGGAGTRFTIVPEPGTLCLLAIAAAAGLLRKGKKVGCVLRTHQRAHTRRP